MIFQTGSKPFIVTFGQLDTLTPVKRILEAMISSDSSVIDVPSNAIPLSDAILDK